jgi:hypothetical protein
MSVVVCAWTISLSIGSLNLWWCFSCHNCYECRYPQWPVLVSLWCSSTCLQVPVSHLFCQTTDSVWMPIMEGQLPLWYLASLEHDIFVLWLKVLASFWLVWRLLLQNCDLLVLSIHVNFGRFWRYIYAFHVYGAYMVKHMINGWMSVSCSNSQLPGWSLVLWRSMLMRVSDGALSVAVMFMGFRSHGAM